MPISVHEATGTFHLYNDSLSYIFALVDGYPFQLYYGARVPDEKDYAYLVSACWVPSSVGASIEHELISFEHLSAEYPFVGADDMRLPALDVRASNGCNVLNLTYRGHTVERGKPALEGLPATYVEDPSEAETLTLVLADDVTGLAVELVYTVFAREAAIARSARIRNAGTDTLTIETALSGSFCTGDDRFELIELAGSWARERHEVRTPLRPGIQGVYSLRGHSSHQFNPFVALVRPETTEQAGEAYGFSLVYSGNHRMLVDVDTYGVARVSAGINPQDFSWRLEPGEAFQTPEVLSVYSADGLGAMSRTFHRVFRSRLARGAWRDRPRPILINNWEATYFDFTEDKLVEVARAAADLGIELFVLDDGWFCNRCDDTAGLGDWEVDRAKLPHGLSGLAERIGELGMGFGLWIEPEMVSPGTRVWTEHPEWVLHAPGQPLRPSRHQYVLDLSNSEVVDYLIERLTSVIGSANISYIKWDMNRSFADVFSQTAGPARQGSVRHAFILGVYELYRRLSERFPQILFESCAGGGGRFDPGMLYFAPQAWTSDDTDAVERLRIQWGTSLVYPLSSMGSHVSAVPNHQLYRVTPLKMRADAAYFGTFGYELDASAFTPEEREAVRAQVAFMKRYRELIQYGEQYRLLSPFAGRGNECAWMVVGEGAQEAVVGYYRVLQEVNVGRRSVRLAGLDPEARYTVREQGVAADEADLYGRTVSGAELMRIGLNLTDESCGQNFSGRGDFISQVFVLDRA